MRFRLGGEEVYALFRGALGPGSRKRGPRTATIVVLSVIMMVAAFVASFLGNM